ncbi:hypothetical protein MPSEU_000467100 [Mayamaea pseudoterrestris]|nr:hypothetical protein MPSEU_000467100 [Mayamaea pseudoterrestris]GKY95028.1 hypothetical protein MPSEU_000467100 [Mayamaea pseudoterrestris]
MYYSTTSLLVVLLSAAATVNADKVPSQPLVTLGLNTANVMSRFGGLEPQATWYTGTQTFGEVNVDGGIDVRVEDVDMMPFNIWARAQQTIKGWNLSARLESSSKALDTVACQLLAVSDDGATRLYAQGSADASARTAMMDKVTLAQKVHGEELTLVPAYHFDTNEVELGVIYTGLSDDTVVNLDTSTKGPQMLTVSQRFGANNRIIPSVTTNGDVELEYRRAIDTGVLAANYKPNKSVSLKWNDGPWLATLEAPMTGPQSFSSDVRLSFKRDVQLF